MKTRAGVLIMAFAPALALAAEPPPSASDVDHRVDALLAQMTLAEKVGQLVQVAYDDRLGGLTPAQQDALRQGLIGSVLSSKDPAQLEAYQQLALTGSRLKIPVLFGYDVIHGFRTVFPIPLGEAASWDPDLVEQAAAVAAREARAQGIAWTFAPMVDIARDPRWGRIAEGAGEDPFLGRAMARARVRGFQGDDIGRPDKLAACAKHFAAYGAAEGGRDYNTVDVSERTLRSVYLPPFKAAVEAGVETLMSAFNDLNGMPCSANRLLLTDVLRKEWGFGGFVVSDWNSIGELLVHRVAATRADAARDAFLAGVDMDMVSELYGRHLPELVAQGVVSPERLDEAVRRVLRLKARLGLLDRPHADMEQAAAALLTPEHRQVARKVAARSLVLLKNERGVLPLSKSVRSIAVIGPLADSRQDMLGSWTADGRPEDVVTVLEGVRQAVTPATRVLHARGCDALGEKTEGFAEAVRVARQAEVAVLVVGEPGDMSGEGGSRAYLDLPGQQEGLVKAVHATGVPVVVVLMSGRPLTIRGLSETVPAILEAWFPGTEAGHAVADVLFGDVNPGGKLPATFPRTLGQVPLYYNHMTTGRPADPAFRTTSRYLDETNAPLYPFGHGLSYTTFSLDALRLSAEAIRPDGRITMTVDVANTGLRAGDEVVQLYLQDVVSSTARPERELAGFRRVTLVPGEKRTVSFEIGPVEMGLYDGEMRFVVEPGEFQVWVGTSSVGGLSGSFRVE
jgi:beta-glucosidase